MEDVRWLDANGATISEQVVVLAPDGAVDTNFTIFGDGQPGSILPPTITPGSPPPDALQLSDYSLPPTYAPPTYSPPDYSAPVYPSFDDWFAFYSPPDYSAPTYSAPLYPSLEYSPIIYSPPAYTAPDYSFPVYSAPDYSFPTYSLPDYASPDYSLPIYSPPDYSVPIYSPPDYSVPDYSFPVYSTPGYSPPTYSPPEYSFPIYSPPDYSFSPYSSPFEWSGGRESASAFSTAGANEGGYGQLVRAIAAFSRGIDGTVCASPSQDDGSVLMSASADPLPADFRAMDVSMDGYLGQLVEAMAAFAPAAAGQTMPLPDYRTVPTPVLAADWR